MKLVAAQPVPAAVSKALALVSSGGVDVETLPLGDLDDATRIAAACDVLVLDAAAGPELIAALRKSDAAGPLPVAVWSAEAAPGLASLEAGADLWIDTSEAPERLALRLGALCRRASLGGSPRLDSPTGVLGASMFDKLLRHEMDRARRYKRPVSVLAVAPDAAPARGVRAPDAEAMRGVAASLRQAIRDVDLLARIDEGRFALLLPETDVAGALKAAERLRRAAAAGEGGAPAVSLSVGVAGYPSRGMDAPEHVLGRALESLVQAIRLGGDRAVPFGAADVVWAKHPPDPSQL